MSPKRASRIPKLLKDHEATILADWLGLWGGLKPFWWLRTKRGSGRYWCVAFGRRATTCSRAAGSAEALDLIGRLVDGIDLVITDVAMHGMGGVELARRALDIRPHLPIVLVSGQPREVLGDFSDLGPSIVLLEKPFLPEVLAATVRHRLDHRQSRGRSKVASAS